jgi:hypothetical protein
LILDEDVLLPVGGLEPSFRLDDDAVRQTEVGSVSAGDCWLGVPNRMLLIRDGGSQPLGNLLADLLLQARPVALS